MSEHDPHHFDPDCPGCRPVIANPRTMKPVPANHPMQTAAERVWDNQLSRDEQEALHRVWVHNSRARADLAVGERFLTMIKNEMSN